MTRTRDLPDSFLAELDDQERSYLSTEDPMRQSGYGGGYERWCRERGILLRALEGDGEFLDIGCANGYLLECLVEWARADGLTLTPCGVDIGPQLIALAKARLAPYAANFWVANAWTWVPPRKFRYVYTLYDCVPDAYFAEYVSHLLSHYVSPRGLLIIGAYGSSSRNEPARDVAADLRANGFDVAGTATEGVLPLTRLAWIRTKQTAS